MTDEAQSEIREKIVSALPESGEWVSFEDLLWDLSGPHGSSCRPFEREIFRLVEEGLLGWSGPVFYVCKTPETAELGRELEEFEREWGSPPGWMLGYHPGGEGEDEREEWGKRQGS